MVLYIVYKRNHELFSVTQLSFSEMNKCKIGDIDLHISGGIQSFTINDGKLVILSKPVANSQEMVIIDYCGEVQEKRVQLHITSNGEKGGRSGTESDEGAKRNVLD